jgi:ferredoxin, 2Fe-2S
MGGSNPYHEHPKVTLPVAPYAITVHLEDGSSRQVTVDPARFPYDHNGLPGSLLDILLGHDIDVDHACGGVCACSTCHLYIETGADTCNESTDAEEDMLDHARALKENSRLACQCVPDGSQPVTVRIPPWNRNLSREGHH